MTTHDAPLSVAIFATNDPRNYSGGRYLSLVMAYALASVGCRVTVYTDHLPSFDADLAPLAPGQVRFVITPDFRAGVEAAPLDWVVLVPTGIFLPDFYDAVTDHAAACGARLALVNFESANWYNAVSPHPRDARLWDAWRRSALDGALVLSIAREGDLHARDFYIPTQAAIRLDVWQPPINSPLAERFDGRPRRPLVVSFVRPSDPHKGGLDLLALPPALLAGHELALVAGRDIDPAFLASVQKHFAAAAGCRITVHTRISDEAKLQLLSEARLLVFPSYFEGYGYPPIEALYCGTPAVCYDLPVLRETVGGVARLVPVGDNAALAEAVAAELARPADPAALREGVRRLANFGTRALALHDLLLRHRDGVPVRRPRAFAATIGPFAGTRPRAAETQDRPPLPPLPFHLIDAREQSGGGLLVTARGSALQMPDRVQVQAGDRCWAAAVLAEELPVPHGAAYRMHLAVPADIAADAELTITSWQGAQQVAEAWFRLRPPLPPAGQPAPAGGLIAEQQVGGQVYLHAWCLASEPVEQVVAIHGGSVLASATVSEQRPELAEAHPESAGRATGFAMALPLAELPRGGLDLLLLGQGRTLGVLAAWPHGTRAGGTRGTFRSAPSAEPVAVWQPEDLSNAHWRRGISLFGDPREPSVLTTAAPAAGELSVGTPLRFASGTVARVVRVQKKGHLWNVAVDTLLQPDADGFPAMVEALPRAAVPDDAALAFAADEDADGAWLNGVGAAPGDGSRTRVRLASVGAAAAALVPGAVLHFADAGPCTALEVQETDGALVVWLDATVGPVRDGAPNPVRLIRLPQPGDRCLRIVPAAGAEGGIVGTAPRRAQVLLEPSEALVPGAVLQFAAAGRLPVLAVEPAGAALNVTVGGTLDPALDGAPRRVHLLGPTHDLRAVRRQPAIPVPDFKAPDPYHRALAARCDPGRVTEAPPTAAAPPRRPRVLFLTLVPPAPANQGNRVVTRNLIRHLVDLGYDVDVVMQGWIDVPAFVDEFGDRARLYHCASPQWEATDEVRARQRARQDLVPALTDLHARLAESVDEFHPFFIVRDETVDLARALLASARYDSIVCNYLHMARVVKELEDEFDLPKVCVVTHDALSNLTRRLGHTALDTTYRACSPAVEREALNAVPGGVAVAISAEEQAYFRDIGVHLPVLLCEYDAAGEFEHGTVDDTAFEARTLIYSASANPLNRAALGWFLDECWADILERVPEARLVVTGPICDVLPAHLPGVTLAGNVERDALLGLMRRSSIAINPCVAGTGLKIKTVEAACLGLPGVCLPAAVDGLADVAPHFAVTATDAAGFVTGCVALLTDARRWQALHQGGLSMARERFSHERVYREVDAAMGWRRQPDVGGIDETPLDGVPAGSAQARLMADPGSLFALRRDRPEDADVRMALARQLAAAGEPQLAHALTAGVAAASPRSPERVAFAARTAIDAGQAWPALVHAAHLVAGPNGVRADGYALMAEALLALDRLPHARDAALQALAIAPARPSLHGLLQRIAERLADPTLEAWALRCAAPPLRLGEAVSVGQGSPGRCRLGTGWSAPEAWGAWTEGATAALVLELETPVTGDLWITLQAHAFTPMVRPRCRVMASVLGHLLAEIEFEPSMTDHAWSFRCPRALAAAGRVLKIHLDLPDAMSPSELGLSPDPRLLGLALHSLRVDTAQEAAP